MRYRAARRMRLLHSQAAADRATFNLFGAAMHSPRA
jgi:hypothetical protein